MAANSINQHFLIGENEKISSFFAKDRHSFIESIRVTAKRVGHFFKTFRYIDEESLFNYSKSKNLKIYDLVSDTSIARKAMRVDNHLDIAPASLKQNTIEAILFILEFIKHPTTVGSIFPSSQSLSKTIVNQISKPACDGSAQKRVILEIGPGTGSFTDKIIKRMGPEDVLYLVEFDEEFCKKLTTKYKSLIDDGKIVVTQADILKYDPEGDLEFDHIVSGLPLNGFDAQFAQDFFVKIKNLSKKGTTFSYFEYMLVPNIIKLTHAVLGKKSDLAAILDKKDNFYQQNKLKVDSVYKNMTPAYVRHHTIAG